VGTNSSSATKFNFFIIFDKFKVLNTLGSFLVNASMSALSIFHSLNLSADAVPFFAVYKFDTAKYRQPHLSLEPSKLFLPNIFTLRLSP
jgi:hypothetical protein